MRGAFRWLAAGIALVFALAVPAELFLQWRADRKEEAARHLTPLARRAELYRPFAVQHLHPQYLFFFPLAQAERLALENDACSLDAEGFRGPGPAQAGPKKLAFLLGGSTAFGYYASSNAATISARLNMLQDEYFFVNAGVPSWNSTQELMRVAFDLAARRPALVVALDGANDAVLAGHGRPSDGTPYPAGTPEHFDEVERLAAPHRFGDHLAAEALFPELTLRLRKIFADEPAEAADDANRFAGEGARRYRDNQHRMADLTAAAGGRFVSVFQPIASLHRKVDRDAIQPRQQIAAFHRSVIAAAPAYRFLDFSAIFDRELPSISIATANLEPGAIFVDDVHLTDRGNELVAGYLWRALRETSAASP